MLIRQQGEGERVWFAGGGVFTYLATAAETDGQFILLQDEMEGGKTTPLHLHPDFDEAFYVLEGELLVHADGEEYEVHQGGFALAPRGVPHAFMVTSESARILAWLIPGSGEDFYRAASEPITSPEDEARPADFQRLRAAADASPSIEILGPPPFKLANLP